MEYSSNLYHHHQIVSSSSSSLGTSSNSFHELGSNHFPCSPNLSLNKLNSNPNIHGMILNSKNEIPIISLNNSMVQDMGFQWFSSNHDSNHSHYDHHHQIIKEEKMSDSFLSSQTTTASLSSSSSTSFDHHQNNLNDLSEKLLIKTLSSSGYNDHHQRCSNDRGHFSFSQIYPTINVSSNWNNSSSSSFDLNSQDMDFLPPLRFKNDRFIDRSLSSENLGLFKGSLPFGSDHKMDQSRLFCGQSKMSPFSNSTNAITEAKRPASSLISHKPNQSSSKKTRLESRAAVCPPFKVRKEKLGDRIAALQQLVAPFGKTDTASVLMEAIGYIKFLHNQVETLSVPYMKSSRSKTCRMMHGALMENVSEESKRDLRSRGLCLVPLSCMSYLTDGGGGIWPPPS